MFATIVLNAACQISCQSGPITKINVRLDDITLSSRHFWHDLLTSPASLYRYLGQKVTALSLKNRLNQTASFMATIKIPRHLMRRGIARLGFLRPQNKKLGHGVEFFRPKHNQRPDR